MFSFLSKEKIKDLPPSPGVYRFDGKNQRPLYIGKAVNLRNRIQNHFRQPSGRDDLFVGQVKRIGYRQTASEIEALLLEARLIKKEQPKYNVVWKDGKNYFSVGLTKEKLPRVILTHQTNLALDYLGPFVDGRALKVTLRLLRRVFPHYTAQRHPLKLCPACHLGLCPGPNPDPKGYRRNIKNLKAVLRGQGTKLLKKLKAETTEAAENRNFEKAAALRDQVFALEKIFAHAVSLSGSEELQKILRLRNPIHRLEAYDISDLQGREAAGSLVVFAPDQPDKSQYRRFKIRRAGQPNDVGMIRETLERRFGHPEWPLPQVMLIDGGRAQLNAALRVKGGRQIKIVALAKRENELFVEGRRKPLRLQSLPRSVFNLILQMRDEAHRFARSYHFYLRKKRLFKG